MSSDNEKKSNPGKDVLDAYKKDIRKALSERVGENEAERLMKDYEPDFLMFYQVGLDAVAASTAMIMGY